jgi:hypothetical protein
MRKLILILSMMLLAACTTDKKDEKGLTFDKNIPENPVFELLDPSQTGIDFINKIINKENFNIFKYRNFYNGGGVGVGDVNNDGLEDVYLTSNQGSNKLYLNKGDFQFEDITEKAGVSGSKAWSTGVTFVDINQDGLLDIYVCNAGNQKGSDQKNELFINQGDLTFKEEASKYFLDENGFTTHAAFFDYDNDGDLDVYILNNSFIPVSSLSYNNKRELRAKDWNLPEEVKGGGDKLLENQNGKYFDVSEKAGIYGSLIGFGLGVTVGDVNQDGYKDLYISNDFYERDYLYINQQDGTFKEDIMNRTAHTSLSSMGADMGDINNDGSLEIFSTDMLPEGDTRLKTTTNFENYDLQQLKKSRGFYNQYMQNALQLNDGQGNFKEIGLLSGVAETDWSWGALMFDMNNDSFKDLYVSNGIRQDLTNQDFIDFFADEVYQKMVVSGNKTAQDSIIEIMPSKPIPNYAFLNDGNLNFNNKTYDLGFEINSFSNGAAYADLDQDGDLDLIVNNVDQQAFVFRNNITNKNYLQLKVNYKTPNIHGIGTIIKAFTDNKVLTDEVMPARGFQSSVSYLLHIGLGDRQSVDSLKIIWPDGSFQNLKDTKVNQQLEITYNAEDTKPYDFDALINKNQYFKAVETEIKAHNEDFYVDFDYEGLIFKMQSREGPCLTSGDINGDGKTEIFIGGAKGQSAQWFTLDGQVMKDQEVFKSMANYEDTASDLADIDGDGDLDILIGSGGNFEVDSSINQYNLRILKNDGEGNFSLHQSIFNPFNTSTIKLYDFDQDGDLDAFVGNFSVPTTYGVNPKSKLFENDGKGNFTDITEQKAYDFKNLGLVKEAVWIDINEDELLDLVVVGEWMAPQFFKNTGRRLERFETNLDNIHGMYNAVYAVDLNNDGKKELVFGNNGNNFKLKPVKDGPIKLYINDFDNNGTIEQIITRTIDGKDKPYQLKRELIKQIPGIKKDNISFKAFAGQSIQDLFGDEKANQSIVKQITEIGSYAAFKTSDGNYEMKYLPQETQLSSIQSFESIEIQNQTYLISAGNFYHFKPQYCRLDASDANIIGFKNGGFYTKPGFNINIKGEVRALEVVVDNSGRTYVIAGRNDDKPIILRYEP